MDVESLAKQLILQNMTPEQQKAVLESVRATLQDARGKQKQRVSENVGAVVDALKKIEADIRARYDDLGNKITARVNSIRDGRDGIDGSDGRDGKDGRPGRDGAQGPTGPAGRDGRDGIDGVDGVSVTDAKIDFDGSLVISLSNGREINVGEVVAPDLAERIKVITNGGGTSQEVLDTLASLQAQIDALVILDYKGTWNASTNTPALASGTGDPGSYYIVSVAGSTNLDGITDWQPGDWAIFNGTEWQKIDQSWATAGTNDNITSMTGITGGISSPDFIQFDTTATVTDATGRLYYDDADQFQTLTFQMNGGTVQRIGEELYYRVKLSAAATKGQVLMFTGTLGASGGLQAAPATGLLPEQASYILGVAHESGITNDWISVTSFGEVKQIDTTGGAETWVQGDVLYYNPLVTGGLTKFKPATPAAICLVAAVVHVGSTNGILFVRPTYGSVLGGTDGNVNFTTLASGNTLIYDAVAGVWENANLTDGTAISITEGPGSITITNTGVTSAVAGTGISVSAATGAVTITNTAPDQTVALTGAGTTSITGTYPNFTVTSNDQYTGTVTSVGGTGTVNGISLSGTVTSSGNLTLGGTLTGVDLATQVTGTLPIANGGTGQTSQTAAFDALAPTTTKGDLIVSNGSDNVRLPVGANNYVLVADSAEATGVKWSAGGSGMADPGANGVVVRTAVNTTTARTITAGTGISVSNGDGVSGNPTITNSGVTSITGTANEVEVSASTGSVTVGLPSAINVNLNGTVGATTPAAGTFTDLTANNSVVISVNSASDALRITQTGTGNALVVEDSANPDSTPFVIDASGNVGIGTTSPTQKLHVSGNILASGSIDCGTQFLGLDTDSATAPSFSFSSDTNTGMFRAGADQVALTTNGTARLTVTTAQFTGTLPWRGQNGTAAAPALSASGDTNTGIYFPAADTIGFSEGGVQVGEFDSSANFKFNSGYGSVATAYGCRAWVNFNGTTNVGGFCTIRESGNVSTVADNGTGDYTVNFATAMPDANYAVAFSAANAARNPGDIQAADYLAGSVRYLVRAGASSTINTDTTISNCIVFR